MIGPLIVEAIRPLPKADVHLMIVEPERYVEDLKRVQTISLSMQSILPHLHRTLCQIKELGKAGVVNPSTPLDLLSTCRLSTDYERQPRFWWSLSPL